MTLRHFLLGAFFAMLIVGCSGPTGSEYVGKWEDTHGTIVEFVKNGDSFIFVLEPDAKFPASINKDGTLQVAGPMGPIIFTYNKSADTLIGWNEEWKRKK